MSLKGVTYGLRQGFIDYHRLHYTIFAQPLFWTLNLNDQAQFIYEHEKEVALVRSEPVLTLFGTILIRASCTCELITVSMNKEGVADYQRKRHVLTCGRFKWPIIEDLSDSTVRKHQQAEMSVTDETLQLIQEEIWSKPCKSL